MALFTKKDLGLILPDDQPGDPVSLRHTKTSDATEQFQELKPKVDASAKVRRYRAGHVPEFAAGYEEERGFVTANQQVRTALPKKSGNVAAVVVSTSSRGRQRVEAQVIKANPKDQENSSRDGSVGGRRARSSVSSDDDSGEDTKNALDDSSSDDDDDEVDRRRQALRKKMLEKEKTTTTADQARTSLSLERSTQRRVVDAKIVSAGPANTVKPATAKQSSESSSGSESEWETDSSESDDGAVLMKPVFVPKKARETIKRQEELEAEEEKRRQKEQEKANARQAELRMMVVEELQREKDSARAAGDTTDTDMPDDKDRVDPEQEYRDWELREMRRIKRDRDRREQRRVEAEETLRRRNLTEEERQAEDEKLKKNEPKEKTKLKFLQKYHHKGAFYMDDDSIRDKSDVRRREASGATLEDNFNKEMMPEVMQVKNFGKSGRTKYTHLAAEDTSRGKDSLWGRSDATRDKFTGSLSGTREISGPSKRRKTES